MKVSTSQRVLSVRMLGVTAAVLASLCGHAAARQDSGKDKAPPADNGVLRGPQVRDNSVPGTKGKFGGTGNQKEQRAQQPIPPRMMMEAIGVLKKDPTPQELRLTAEQETKIQDVHEDFRAKQKAFVDQHRDEIMKLRSELGPDAKKKIDERLRALPGFGGRAGGPDGTPGDNAKGRPERRPGKGGGPGPGGGAGGDDAMKETSPADQSAALAKLKELAEKAPDAKDAQTRAWAVLTDGQKPIVEKELARLRKEGGARGPGAPDAGGPGGDRLPPGVIGADGKVDMSKLPPRLRERLEKMSPEEREKAIQRLKERVDAGRKGAGKGGNGAKPAPEMDDVQVPAPESDTKPR